MKPHCFKIERSWVVGRFGLHIPAAAEEAAEKALSLAAFPQRLEASVDCAAVTARVEFVPFPFVRESGVFPQRLKPPLICGICGTAEAVPFQSKSNCSQRLRFDIRFGGDWESPAVTERLGRNFEPGRGLLPLVLAALHHANYTAD